MCSAPVIQGLKEGARLDELCLVAQLRLVRKCFYADGDE